MFTSTALSVSMFSSIASASTTVNEPQEKIQIQVASTDTVVTKKALIKKLREYFPNKFDFLTNNDFDMGSTYYYPGDETIRYELHFQKTVNGKEVYGYAGFVGEDLQLESFYYEPANTKDALFPAKVSEEKAQKIATDFLKKFVKNSKDYKIEETPFDLYNYYYYSNQLLTEPIRYPFSFVRQENGVSIEDQKIEVTVLGNGEISNLYQYTDGKKAFTFDDVKKKQSEEALSKKIKDNFAVELQYQVMEDYRTNEQKVQLVYVPTAQVLGMNALTGEWQTVNGFSANLPSKKVIEKLVENPIAPKYNGISVEEAKQLAEQVLKIDSNEVKLVIESIEEAKGYLGKEIISINYSYEYKNGGTGASLEIDKQTGDIIQYYDLKNEVLKELGQKPNNGNTISKEEALNKAIGYLKEMAPSYLHNYVKPIDEPYQDENDGIYSFTFPRIVNGILVSGDEVSVSIAADGSLNNLYVNSRQVEEWPSTEDVISKEEALAAYKDALSLKLKYVRQNDKDLHYNLVYSPVFNDSEYTYIDANTGEWDNLFAKDSDLPVISHTWAEDELNYLIQTKILEVKDPAKFNGDAPVTKGDALKVLVKSLSYFYEDYYSSDEEMDQSYANIDSDHPLYDVVERAVDMGILNPESDSFDPEKSLTREELAVWYVRVLGLEGAAKYSDIYKLNFKDESKIQKKYAGHVALANAMGLLTANQSYFKPDQQITYAHLAVTTIRLAHQINEQGMNVDY